MKRADSPYKGGRSRHWLKSKPAGFHDGWERPLRRSERRRASLQASSDVVIDCFSDSGRNPANVRVLAIAHYVDSAGAAVVGMSNSPLVEKRRVLKPEPLSLPFIS
jgi:ATP-dependent DNA ligase